MKSFPQNVLFPSKLPCIFCSPLFRKLLKLFKILFCLKLPERNAILSYGLADNLCI